MKDRIKYLTRRETLTRLGSIGSITALAATSAATSNKQRQKDVRTTIEKSQSYLLTSGIRRDDYWESRIREYGNDSDIHATIYYLLLLDHLGIENRSQRDALSYLLNERVSDGGWNNTALDFSGRFLLRSLDRDRYQPVIDDITDEIQTQGMSITDRKGLRTDTAEIGPFNAVFQLKLFFALMNDRYTVEELFPEGSYKRITKLLTTTPAFDLEEGINPMKPMVHQAVVATFLSFATIAEVIRGREEDPLKVNGKLLHKQLARIVLKRRLPNATWGPAPDTVFGLLAIHESEGYDQNDREIQIPLEWIRKERQGHDGHIITFRMPIWDTGLALRALHESGYSLEHPVIKRGAQYLVNNRTTNMALSPLDVPLDRLPVPFRENFGNGWGYTPHLFSDWDDTAIAVNVLSRYGTEVVSDDVEFLLDVQNNDGSWSAFVSNFSPFDGERKREIINEIGRPAYEFLFNTHASPDVTGHALEALGRTGSTVENSEAVRRAVEYYRRSQNSNDMWIAVWGAGYTYGTSSALLGMDTVETDMEQSFVQNAVDALLDKQFDSGGWGDDSAWDFMEEEIPYESNGPKISQTGWVIQSLIAAGVDTTHPAIEDGITYLIEQQRTDGSWRAQGIGANFGPPFFKNETATQAAPLRALSDYAKLRDIPLPDPDESGWLDSLFD